MTIFQGKFARNFSWLLGSEGLVRVTRLGTAVVLARHLTAFEFGIAALAIASHELLRVLAQNGFGLRLIREADAHIDRLSNTLYVLNWLWCLGLFAIQCCAAWAVARYYNHADLQGMLIVLAAIYLAMPLGLTHMYRVQRRQQLKITAWVDSSQIMIDNLLTAALAIAGFGAWAIVLPKLIVVPIWVVGYRIAERWQFRPAAGFASFRGAFTETRSVLSAELARSVRAQMDIFVIGRFLGTEALGIYYFARNAGLGISLALLQAAAHAMLPRFGELHRRFGISTELRSATFRILGLLLLVTLPIIVAQTALAPLYVPLAFGDQWSDAIPVLMVLCLSAVPRIVGESITQLARASGHAHIDARWNIWSVPVFLCCIVLGSSYGLLQTAIAICVFHFIYQSLFVTATMSGLFGRSVPTTLPARVSP